MCAKQISPVKAYLREYLKGQCQDFDINEPKSQIILVQHQN